jgi:GTPase SAR1 family protein
MQLGIPTDKRRSVNTIGERTMTEEDEAFNEIERRSIAKKEAVRATITKGKTMNNSPAFPGKQKALLIQAEHVEVAQEYEIEQNGMTLRDYFAAKAMLRTSVGSSYEQLAKTAYEIADAMLAARGQK